MYTVHNPSSKSYSHRYIIGACVGTISATIHSVLECDDISATTACMELLGMNIQGSRYDGSRSIFTQKNILTQEYSLNVGGSATLSRFLTCILAVAPKATYTLYGNAQLQKRSHVNSSYYASLLSMDITFLEKEGFLPYSLCPNTIPSKKIYLPSNQSSSQYISGMLIAYSVTKTPQEIYLIPSETPSFPYICSTLYVLQNYGIAIELFVKEENTLQEYTPISLQTLYASYPEYTNTTLCIRIMPSTYSIIEHTVPSDCSTLSYLLSFGILGMYPLAIACSGLDAPQGDSIIIDHIRAMGGSIERKDSGVQSMLYARPSLENLHAIDADMTSCPDIFPTMAVLLALAKGTATLHNIARIRTKECDRVHAMAEGLRLLGHYVEETEDTLRIGDIVKPPTETITISTYGDHRIAMAFALYMLAHKIHFSHSTINTLCVLDDTACVTKSFPNFWDIYTKVSPH